jgi:photosystem II stability/assembly factor-like uncharacterized protein
MTTALYEGPPKDVSPSSPTRGFTTHKVRSNWFQAREAWPLREAPIGMLTQERARVAAALPPAAGQAAWSPIGPANIGGRMTCAVCKPDEPEQLWAGSAGGGVWHSPNGGQTWEPLWHDEASLNVGALAIDPQDPQAIYAATGEANLSADSHPGVGLFRSLNAGRSWQLLAAADAVGLPRRIGALAVDSSDPRHLLVGGVGHHQGDTSGLYTSSDGGVSWARVPFVADDRSYRCHDVRFRPDRPGVIFATISAMGMDSGIWRSSDNGATWRHLADGLPSPDMVGRTSLALAPSDADIVYAQIAHKGAVLGVFRSSDGGDTWDEIGGVHFTDERQMSYNNAIVVHPEDPDWVLCGGVDLHRTTDGGRTWKQVTQWNADRGTSTYAHADHHALVMPPAEPGLVYDLNDGGLDISSDGGTSWANRSNGLATNMFYDLTVAQSDGLMIAGGAQDNGTLATLDGKADSYFELTGGDGGWVIIDPEDNRHLFTTAQGMRIFRFRSSDGWTEVSPPEDLFQMWMVFMSMDVSSPTTVFTGSRRVWRTRDDGDTWQPVSDNLDDSDITALEVARADSRRVYVGTENGGIFRSTDAGETWSGNLATTVLPGRTVTRLESRANDADVVYATVANFGNRHVFRSRDGGLTWEDVDRGVLPDVPFHSLAVPAAHPHRVYACGDAGVFVSEDDGATWSNLTRNLPTVMVVDLVYHEADRTLTAATYGRSSWRLRVD